MKHLFLKFNEDKTHVTNAVIVDEKDLIKEGYTFHSKAYKMAERSAEFIIRLDKHTVIKDVHWWQAFPD